MSEKRKTGNPLQRHIDHADEMIRIQKRRLQRCIDEPDVLSSDNTGRGTIPIGLLKERYEKAIKNWEKEKRRLIKLSKERGWIE